MNELEDTHFWFLAKREFVNSVLYQYKNYIKNILDVGSGTGGMTKHLYKFGRVVGIENNDLAISLSKKRRLKIIKGKAQKLPFTSNSFDLVTFFDVLYHKKIGEEKGVLDEAYRVLKPNGYILITDSAFEFLKSGHDIATQGKKRYRLGDIITLLHNSKFEIIKKSYIYFSIFPMVIVKRILINKVLNKNDSDVASVQSIINNILYKILKIEAFFLRYISFPFGSSVLVLAKKI